MSALNDSQPGDAVYDPFCGSGTTLIACEPRAASATQWRLMLSIVTYVVLVTGVTSGLGEATAKLLSGIGFRVFGTTASSGTRPREESDEVACLLLSGDATGGRHSPRTAEPNH